MWLKLRCQNSEIRVRFMTFERAPSSRIIFVVWILVILGLISKSLSSGTFGQIGFDPDDAMRLVQIRDFLAGQSWFDVTQYRMGPDGGTDMHWSRVADIPMLILITFFDLFLSYDRAEQLAYIIWPPLSIGLVIWGLFAGARHMGARQTDVLTALVAFVTLLGFFRFLPGAIDHHNLQMGLLAVSIGFALDPDMRSRSFVISGIAAGISVTIGPEVYFFLALICGFFALNWLFNPIKAKHGTQAMGFGFAAILALIFFGTIAPSRYGVIYCDSYSLITFLACSTGGVGLALSARFLSEKPFRTRLFALIVLGAVCTAIFLTQAPQCLANPLDSLPMDVQTEWLDNIQEAKPLLENPDEWIAQLPYSLGLPVVALLVLVWRIRRGELDFRVGFLLALIVLCIGLTFYQVRFGGFGHLASLFVTAPWVGELYVKGRQKEGPNVNYIFAAALCVPTFWALPGILVMPENEAKTEQKEASEQCYSDDVVAVLNDLELGRFLASTNDSAELLMLTHHSALAGNYHRNIVGISESIKMVKATPDVAFPLIRDNKIDYVLFCNTAKDADDSETTTPEAELSLAGALFAGIVPDYLEPVTEPMEDGLVYIFRVKTPNP